MFYSEFNHENESSEAETDTGSNNKADTIVQTVDNYDFVQVLIQHMDKKFDELRAEIKYIVNGGNNIKFANNGNNKSTQNKMFKRLPVNSLQELEKLESDCQQNSDTFNELVS